MSEDREFGPIRSYGRIKARALKPRQAGLVDSLLPHLALPEDGPIDLAAVFGASGRGAAPDPTAGLRPPSESAPAAPRGYVLEIGFGGGEHLAAQAAAAPERGFIGVEPFLNGVGSCLRHIEESGVANVRLHHGDARDVLGRLANGSLDLVYILFPDPWPKKRHWKRRLVNAEFVAELARVVKPGGEVRFATDWAHYAAQALELFHNEHDFAWTAECAADWRNPWEGHVATRYEQKRLGDCAPIWLRFLLD